jgi:hypothetical protein
MCRSLSPKVVKLASGEFPKPKSASKFISRAFSIGRSAPPEQDFTRASSNEDLRVLNVKKKAFLAAKRICEKCPDLQQDYYEAIQTVIKEKEHGLVLSALPLVTLVCQNIIKEDNFKKKPKELLMKVVKVLTSTAFNLAKNTNSEYEVNKVNDPFLIISIYSLMKDILSAIINYKRSFEGKYTLSFVVVKNFFF